jgi:hypothetical protein
MEKDIDTSSHISLPRPFLFYISEYPPARAKYSYHVARLGLSVVRHSFPTFFSVLSYHSLPLPLSVLLLLLSSCQRLRIPNLSFLPRFTDYGRSYYLTTFCYPSIYDRGCCYLSPSLSFYLFFSFSRALPYIYLPPNMMLLYIRAPAASHPLFYSISRNYMMLQ